MTILYKSIMTPEGYAYEPVTDAISKEEIIERLEGIKSGPNKIYVELNGDYIGSKENHIWDIAINNAIRIIKEK